MILVSEIYRFPFILVETNCDTIKDNRYCYCLKNHRLHRDCASCEKCFVEHPYEEAYKLIVDLHDLRVKKDFVVYTPKSNQGIYIHRETTLSVVEITGASILLLVSEGDEITENSVIAKIFTSKGELRNFRTRTSGVILYITDAIEGSPEKILILIGDKNSLGRVEIEY